MTEKKKNINTKKKIYTKQENATTTNIDSPDKTLWGVIIEYANKHTNRTWKCQIGECGKSIHQKRH